MKPQLLAILDHLPAALLVIFRIGGLMIYGPVLSASVIPARVRVMLAFIIGIAAYPLLSAMNVAHLDVELNVWSIAPLAAMELLLGVTIGYLASLPLQSLQIGGLIAGQQMGLGFAQIFNPTTDDESDLVGQLLFFMAIAGFLLIGGHEAMLIATLDSFQHIPLGGFAPDHGLLDLIAGLLIASLEVGLRVAAPLLCLVFLETVAMGFLAKTVPQLNILSLGFPIRILIGMLVIGAGLVVINDVALDGIDEALHAITIWLTGYGAGGAA